MSTQEVQFAGFSRLLHWTMAAMILAMLFIGVAMVASLADYHVLVSIHRPLGIAILLLVVVRFVNRLWNRPPPFPPTMSRAERLTATASLSRTISVSISRAISVFVSQQRHGRAGSFLQRTKTHNQQAIRNLIFAQMGTIRRRDRYPFQSHPSSRRHFGSLGVRMPNG